MKLSTRSPVLLVALLCATASLAQDSAAPPPAPAPPPAEAEAEAEAEDESPPPAERPDVDVDEFIPTEELGPDAAVTFPVDI